MRCRTCGSPMVTEHCESGASATTCWHSCPLCRQVRLTSEPDVPTALVVADAADVEASADEEERVGMHAVADEERLP